MAKLTFAQLSDDIKALIVSEVLRPTDLVNVCLVNKQLHEIAVKSLYRTIAFDIGHQTDARLTSLLNPANTGLKHIRVLTLYANREQLSTHEIRQAHLTCRMILEFLPKDTLEEFSWRSWEPFLAENILLLYRNQRRLRMLEVADLDGIILPQLQKEKSPYKDAFSQVYDLSLYPGSTSTLDLCDFFVARLKNELQFLHIHTDFPNNDGDSDQGDAAPSSRDINDSATRPGLLTATIFRSLTPFDKCDPLPKLKYLDLEGVNLRFCADTWLKVINFRIIETLRIGHCPGADTLLGQLSKADNLPERLHRLELVHCDNTHEETLVALDGFLCLVSGIEELMVDLCSVNTLPAADSIICQGKTLRRLNVHGHNHPSSTRHNSDGTPIETIWSTEDFAKICKGCPAIHQLSCAWPVTSLITSPSFSWTLFLEACSKLRRLITLHITTFPNTEPSETTLSRTYYERLLQGLAQQAFETIRKPIAEADGQSTNDQAHQQQPIIRLIAFGINDNIFDRRDDPKHQIIFCRSTCMDAEGKQSTYAAKVSWALRKYIEPRSRVLDDILSIRGVEPPIKKSSAWGDDDDD